jgi:hypothetical protein
MFLLIALSGYSTGASTIDTTGPATSKAMRNALAAKDSLDIMIRERDSLKLVNVAYGRLATRDSQLITALDQNVKLAQKLIINLEAQVANSEKQTDNGKAISGKLNDIIRKKNWTIIKKTAKGAAIVGALIYLLIKK